MNRLKLSLPAPTATVRIAYRCKAMPPMGVTDVIVYVMSTNRKIGWFYHFVLFSSGEMFRDEIKKISKNKYFVALIYTCLVKASRR